MSEYQSPFAEPHASPDESLPEAPHRAQPRAHDGRWDVAPWAGGLVMIALGVVFLLRNVGLNLPILHNWWALFILIPAVNSLSQAWRSFKANGWRFGGQTSGSFVGGLALTLVALTFLLGLSWSVVWPVFLILAGIGALLGGLLSG